ALPKMGPYGAPERTARGVPAKARRLALRGIRHYGKVTARWRVRPDYLIIGTKRGGSTSLAKWVLEHPDVRPLFPARETRKGTYFYDVNFDNGLAWYRSHFPTGLAMDLAARKRGTRPLVGEATPYYLHHPHAPARARQDAPDAKVIALLRDPADRAYGHWGERTRNGVEWLSFEEALDAEPERLDGAEEQMIADPAVQSFAHQHFSYVDQGRYARGLERWLTAFPAEQVLTLRSEDLYADPAAVYDEVLDFLDLGQYAPSELTGWNRTSNDALTTSQRDRLHSMLDPAIAATEAVLGRRMNWS
ncbi:MAG: sulfotransferase domain-containing protein, partial [Acidimicrobiales bacterium]